MSQKVLIDWVCHAIFCTFSFTKSLSMLVFAIWIQQRSRVESRLAIRTWSKIFLIAVGAYVRKLFHPKILAGNIYLASSVPEQTILLMVQCFAWEEERRESTISRLILLAIVPERSYKLNWSRYLMYFLFQ